MKKNRIILLSIVFILLLIGVLFGLSYAYFKVLTLDNFNESTIRAETEDLAVIEVNGIEANLKLNLSAKDMNQQAIDTSYFASKDDKKTHNYEEVIGVARVNPNTDSNRYHCTYTLKIEHSGVNDMYNKFTNNYSNKSADQIKLILNHKRYDWNDGMPLEVEQDFYIEGEETKNITAGLQFINKNGVIQNELAGTDIRINISIKEGSLKCEAVEKLPMLLDGVNLALKMKKIAEPDNSEITSASYQNKNITAIKRYVGTPDDSLLTEEHEVQTTDSEKIYMWFDNGIMYFWSKSEKVMMNPNGNAAFFGFINLTDISDFQYIDTSKTTSLAGLFAADTNLTSLHGLENWDVSKVTSFAQTFQQCAINDLTPLANWDTSSATTLMQTFVVNNGLTSLHGLENWDVSNVKNAYLLFAVSNNLADITALANWDTSSVEEFNGIFQNDYKLASLHGLENWNTSSATSMKNMFYNNTSVVDLSPLANWDTSSAINMNSLFSLSGSNVKVNDAIIDLSPLANWNVSKVEDMNMMFQNNNIESFKPLKKWNVSNVRDFGRTFYQTNKSTTTSLEGLENWNVKSATNMYSMFANGVSFENVSAINDWDVTGVTNFESMFYNSKNGIHPEFSKVTGTWDSNGTFTKSS